MSKETILNIIGWYFLISGLLIIGVFVWFKEYVFILWFCDHVSIIVGLAILFRNRFWTTAGFIFGLIPQLIWDIDFITKYFFDFYTVGVTSYMFQPNYSTVAFIIGLNHFWIIPLLVWAVWLLKPSTNAWIGAFIHGIIMWGISYFSKAYYYNVNCVKESCIPFLPQGMVYQIIWPTFYLFVVIFPVNKLLVWLYNLFHK